MRKRSAALGSIVFYVVGPGGVVGLVPWLITRWEMREPLPYWLVAQIVGGVLVAAAAAVLVHAFVRFVAEGIGTPVPAAAPQRLVVGGLYRYVRNPMYVALLAGVLGQALLLGQLSLVVYAAFVWAAPAAFVRWYEEPTLLKRFGADYEEYRRAVPAWLPRLRPWYPAGSR